MGGKITSALSQETRDLLKENKDFFDLVAKTTKLGIKGKDSEAKTEVELREDGSIAVTFVLPVDDNPKASDGRIYLRDTFVFDAQQKQLKGYNRDFTYNGRGENKEEWKQWLAQYKAAALPGEDYQKAFGLMVARSYARPFLQEHFPIFSKKKQEFFGDFIAGTDQAGMMLRLKDPRSHYTVINRGLTTEVIFSYIVADSTGAKSGHLLLQDKFVLNGNSGAMVGFDRQVKPGTDSAEDPYWQGKAASLNEIAKPSLETASGFIKDFMPGILNAPPAFAGDSKAELAPPPGGYGEFNDLVFKKTMNAMVRAEKAVPLMDLEPDFYKALSESTDYFAPLKAALGNDLPLNLKDPPLEVSTEVSGDKTFIYFKYSFRPDAEKSSETGYLDYTERWTFEKGLPAKIDRRAQTFGADAGGIIDKAGKAINDGIQNDQFPPLKDTRTLNLIAGVTPYLAPELSYTMMGGKKILEQPELSGDQRLLIGVLDQAVGTLKPLLYQPGVDVTFRNQVLRIFTGIIYNDGENIGAQDSAMAMSQLQRSEAQALEASKTPEEKQRHEDNLRLVNTVFALSSGDAERARDLVAGMHSPAFKRAFKAPIETIFAKKQALEGLVVMSKVAEDQINIRVRDSKAWLNTGPKLDKDIEKKTLDGLFQKTFLQSTLSKSRDPLAVLRKVTEIGKGKKPEELSAQDKKLTLTAEERVLADRILQDPLMARIAGAAQEDAKDVQAKSYFEIARGDLFEKGLVNAAKWLTVMVAKDKMPRSRAGESLDLLKMLASEQLDKTAKAKLDVSPDTAQSYASLMKKLVPKVQQDPKKPIVDQLKALSELSDGEKKIRDQLVANPAMVKISEAAVKPALADRIKIYREQFATLNLKPEVQTQLDKLLSGFEKPPEQNPVVLENLQALGMFAAIEFQGEHGQTEDGFKAKLQTLQSLMQKCGDAVSDPKSSSFDALKLVKDSALSPAEKQLREQLLANSNLQQVSDIAAKPDAAERIKAYQDLLAGYQLPDAIGQKFNKNLASLNGGGSSEAPGIEGAQLAPLLFLSQQMADAGKIQTELGGKQKAVQGLLEKASLEATSHPNETAFQILQRLKDSDLEDGEKTARDELLKDENFKKVTAIAAEPAGEKRAKQYSDLLPKDPEKPTDKPVDGVLKKAGYPQTEAWLSQMLLSGKIPDKDGTFPQLPQGAPTPPQQASQEKLNRDVQAFLALTEGNGSFGTKFGYALPHFAKEVSKPTTLVAMTIAPFAGAGCEFLGLWRFRNLGLIGRGVATTMGVVGEAGAFTYSSKVLDSAFYSPEGQWDHHIKDFKNNILLFGSMRAAHYGSAAFSERVLATGKFGKWAGSYVAGESGGVLSKTPAGRIVRIPGAPGPGVPQLTVNGQRLATVLEHGSSLAAMHYSSKLSNKLGWQQQKMGFDDTLMMYMQAMVGFNLANKATGGKLSSGVAGLRLRMDNIKAQDLVLTDSVNGTKFQWTSPKADAKKSLDSFLLDSDGNEIQVWKDAAGKMFLKDGRKPEASEDASEPTKEPDALMRNGKPVPSGEAVEIKTGDVIAFGKKVVQVKLPSGVSKAPAKPQPPGMIHLFEGELPELVLTDVVTGAKLEWNGPRVEQKKAEEAKVDSKETDKKKSDEKKSGKKKSDKKKVDDKKADGANGADPKVDESQAKEPKPVEPKADDPKADDAKAEEPKVEEKKAEKKKPKKIIGKTSLDTLLLGREGNDIQVLKDSEGNLLLLDGQKMPGPPTENTPTEPLVDPESVMRNGKLVAHGEPTPIFDGDLITVGNKEVRVSLPESSPLHVELAKAPRTHQLSLAREIGKAKDPAALFKALKDSALHGAPEVMEAIAEVFAGKRPLDSLPTELGMRAKVKALLESQVAEMKKAGLEMGPGYVLRAEARDPRLTPLEVEFQTLKAMETLKLRVAMTRNLAELLEVIGDSSFETIGGVKVEEIFDWLGHEKMKAVLDQVNKTKADFEKKIELATDRIKVEKSKKWPRPNKEFIKQLEEHLEKWQEKVAQTEALGTALEAHLKQLAEDAPDSGEVIGRLPADFGIRQKARDAAEQADGQFAKSLSEKDLKESHALLKKYVDVQVPEDLNVMQGMLRQALDTASPQTRLMLRRLKPEEMKLLLKLYFGAAESRELSGSDGFRLATILGGSNLGEGIGLSLPMKDANTVKLVRGDLDALVLKNDGEALILRTHSANKDGKSLVFTRGELLGLAEQAKNLWSGAEAGAQSYRGAPEIKLSLQNSDAQLFFDPETRSFQSWVIHPQGISKVRVTLTENGELESFEIKFAAKPGSESGTQKVDLLTPPKLDELTGADGEVIPVEGERVDYQALIKEFPFDVPGVTRGERLFDGVAKATDKIPSLPKFGKAKKFGVDGPAKDGKAETEKAKDDKDVKDQGEDSKEAAPAKGKRKKLKKSRKSGPEAKKADAKPKTDTDPSAAPKTAATTATGQGIRAFLRGKIVDPIGALFAGLKRARPKSSEASKPENKQVTPAKAPPKAEGNRPTLPEGLVLPMGQIGMGEMDSFEAKEIKLDASFLMGEVSGRTHEGVGREENQDGISMTYTHDADLILAAADGMGGQDKGKEATQVGLQTFNKEVQKTGDVVRALVLANEEVIKQTHSGSIDAKKPGVGIVVAKIKRPAIPNGPHSLETYSASDLKMVLLRRGPDGDWHWVYRTVEDNFGRHIVDAQKEYGPKGEGRDLLANSHPHSNKVTNFLGSTPLRVVTTSQGEVPDVNTGFRSAGDLQEIALEKGDLALLGSDGTWKNIPDMKVLQEWLKDVKTTDEAVRILNDKVHTRMKIANEAEQKFEKHELAQGSRMAFQLDGKDLFIDETGKVWDQAEGGNHVDHYEADNFSLLAYLHNPNAKADPKKIDSKPPKPKQPDSTPTQGPDTTATGSEHQGPAPVSDTDLSEQVTGIWKRPTEPPENPKRGGAATEGADAPMSAAPITEIPNRFLQGIRDQVFRNARDAALAEAAQHTHRDSPFSAVGNAHPLTLRIDGDSGAVVPEGETVPHLITLQYQLRPDENRVALDPASVSALHWQLRECNPDDDIVRTILQALLDLPRLPLVIPRGQELALQGQGTYDVTVLPPADPQLLASNQQFLLGKDGDSTIGMTMMVSAKSYAVKHWYKVGVLTLDGEGRIVGSTVGRPDFQSPRGTQYRKGIQGSGDEVPVILFGDTVMWHGPLGDLNARQQSAILALADANAARRDELKAQDPYAVDAILGEGLGKMAMDISGVVYGSLNKQGLQKPDGSLELSLSVLRDPDGLLRAYRENSAGGIELPEGETVVFDSNQIEGLIHLKFKPDFNDSRQRGLYPKVPEFEFSVEPWTRDAKQIEALLNFLKKDFHHEGPPNP